MYLEFTSYSLLGFSRGCKTHWKHPTRRTQTIDRSGWNFTQDTYSQIRLWGRKTYPDIERQIPTLGPHITSLQALSWKTKCAPQLKHILWQIMSGCLSVRRNLNNPGIKCDTRCDRCGGEKTIIMFFLRMSACYSGLGSLKKFHKPEVFSYATSLCKYGLPVFKDLKFHTWSLFYMNTIVYLERT